MANKENIRKWVDALRSDKYKQTKKTLFDGRGYCCLGVACEIAIENGADVVKVFDEANTHRWFFDSKFGSLPVSVCSWLGLRPLDSDPSLRDPATGEYCSCTTLNDHRGASFKTIASRIEATYLV